MQPKNYKFEKTEKIDWISTNNLTAYDTKSIMHYDGTLRGFFSNPIMTDKITGKSIGINRELSQLDIQKLNKMYPCKPIGPICGKFWYTFILSLWAMKTP